jgi:hypothetical protein
VEVGQTGLCSACAARSQLEVCWISNIRLTYRNMKRRDNQNQQEVANVFWAVLFCLFDTGVLYIEQRTATPEMFTALEPYTLSNYWILASSWPTTSKSIHNNGISLLT